ncbi:hypothetical protein B0T14DRAFT_550088 [Immersiella caudata]|uniref:Uncharacterized protein n=1 Tax=Immersiella caudata TaxID=314043 RepID=A0AA40CBS4_9PEZI|nr:hypothetical protein B0T14DRAFT_550088 [Immersiella caudata]
MEWTGGESAPKIYTLISYDPENTKSFFQGASVNQITNRIIGVKLLLDPDQERSLYLPTRHLQHDTRNLPKRPVEVAADFIRAIYEHALVEIAKKVPERDMSLCQKKSVLSAGCRTANREKT